MNTYEINLQNGYMYTLQGATISHCKETGQSIIYSNGSTVNRKIVAIVPATAFVKVRYANSSEK